MIDNVAILFFFGGCLSDMEFIIDEAEIKNDFYSSDESDKECSSSDDFLTDDEETVAKNDVNFYRSFDNREEFLSIKKSN